MDNQTFELLLVHLDEIKEQNKQQLTLLSKHIADDAAVANTVERHNTYFVGLGVALTPVLAYIATKLGLK
ncbi:MAG: hypothetical protein ACRCZI_10490 [Cetobacterium sp.]